jgi:hypothetical protein
MRGVGQKQLLLCRVRFHRLVELVSKGFTFGFANAGEKIGNVPL